MVNDEEDETENLFRFFSFVNFGDKNNPKGYKSLNNRL